MLIVQFLIHFRLFVTGYLSLEYYDLKTFLRPFIITLSNYSLKILNIAYHTFYLPSSIYGLKYFDHFTGFNTKCLIFDIHIRGQRKCLLIHPLLTSRTTKFRCSISVFFQTSFEGKTANASLCTHGS